MMENCKCFEFSFITKIYSQGLLSHYIVQLPPELAVAKLQGESPIQCYIKVLLSHLNTKSALQRLVCGLVVCEWAKLQKDTVEAQELITRF